MIVLGLVILLRVTHKAEIKVSSLEVGHEIQSTFKGRGLSNCLNTRRGITGGRARGFALQQKYLAIWSIIIPHKIISNVWLDILLHGRVRK